MTKEKFDVQAEITNKIVSAIEAGIADGSFKMPWHGVSDLPRNVITKKPYSGINAAVLWVIAAEKGYSNAIWGTYKQWAEKGAQVRKGEKSALVMFWKPYEKVKTMPDGSQKVEKLFFARASFAFNADQVDGYEIPKPVVRGADTLDRIEVYIARTGATIRPGKQACYVPSKDEIRMPDKALFHTTEGYYSTALHELVHWTGAKPRLNRELSTRFGSEAYAFEELVAEIGAAYACASLGITTEPRPDHAQYCAGWLKTLNNDPKAIITAGSMASKAVAFLDGLQDADAKEAAA